MQILKTDFEKIKDYIRNQLLENFSNNQILTRTTLIGVMEEITLEKFLAVIGEKKERVKAPLSVEKEEEDFKFFWDNYPTGNFTYKMQKFTCSRALKANKQVCYQLYLKALQEAKITPKQLLMAMHKQVAMLKRESYEKGTNQLQFFKSIEVYLRQMAFEGFLQGKDEVNVEEEEETDNSFNI